MLLSFTVENWMSFKERASFSMVATREKQHGERVPFVNKYKTKILPVAAIYGGNASGKTNFFKALNFIKNMVIDVRKPDSTIPVEQYRLDKKCLSVPSSFVVVILVDNEIYEFAFSLTKTSIIEEKLVHIKSASEKVLYHRRGNKINFTEPLTKNDRLKFVFEGTRDNQLFLSNSIMQKIDIFKPVYDWFNDRLELIAPDTRFASFEYFFDSDNPLYNTMNEMLPLLDTGISFLGGEEIPIENISFPDEINNDILADIKEGMSARIIDVNNNDRFIVSRKDDNLIIKKMITKHSTIDGTDIKFDMKQESDGSQRIIDLLPAFLNISDSKSQKVFVIDELDRSLHTLLTSRILNAYLDSCSTESRSQLLFTTHDVLLMNQDLFRRDEMWVTERNRHGASKLCCFSEYKDVRNDKDIRKSYLQGRLGGIPKILFSGNQLSLKGGG